MKEVTKIVVNGREYDGIGQMPPEVREEYERALQAFRELEDKGAAAGMKPAATLVKESFVYEGRTYNSREELPPEVREALERSPQPAPGEKKSQVDIITTKTLPSRVRVFDEWGDVEKRRAAKKNSFSPWPLVLVLGLILSILLFLWLSGVKPSSLWPH